MGGRNSSILSTVIDKPFIERSFQPIFFLQLVMINFMCLTGLRDAQSAGQTLLLGVSVGGFPEEISH